MKKTLTTTILALITITSYAQNTHMLGITIGTTNPIGNFSKDDDSTSGYAKSGLCYTLNYDYTSPKNWGGFFTFANQSFAFDAQEYTNINDPDYQRYNYAWNNYNIKSINTGYSYIFNKNGKISIIPKIGTGLNIIKSRVVEADYLVFGSNMNFKETIQSQLLFNINFGVDLTFRKSIESQLSYYVRYNINSSSGESTNNATIKINGVVFDQFTDKTTKSYGFSSFSVGARYILKKKSN